jgi:hypothetical protein
MSVSQPRDFYFGLQAGTPELTVTVAPIPNSPVGTITADGTAHLLAGPVGSATSALYRVEAPATSGAVFFQAASANAQLQITAMSIAQLNTSQVWLLNSLTSSLAFSTTAGLYGVPFYDLASNGPWLVYLTLQTISPTSGSITVPPGCPGCDQTALSWWSASATPVQSSPSASPSFAGAGVLGSPLCQFFLLNTSTLVNPTSAPTLQLTVSTQSDAQASVPYVALQSLPSLQSGFAGVSVFQTTFSTLAPNSYFTTASVGDMAAVYICPGQFAVLSVPLYFGFTVSVFQPQEIAGVNTIGLQTQVSFSGTFSSLTMSV